MDMSMLLLTDMALQYTLSTVDSHSYAYIPFTFSHNHTLGYDKIHYIYINPIYKITKLANIQVNTNNTKLAQMKTLGF